MKEFFIGANLTFRLFCPYCGKISNYSQAELDNLMQQKKHLKCKFCGRELNSNASSIDLPATTNYEKYLKQYVKA